MQSEISFSDEWKQGNCHRITETLFLWSHLAFFIVVPASSLAITACSNSDIVWFLWSKFPSTIWFTKSKLTNWIWIQHFSLTIVSEFHFLPNFFTEFFYRNLLKNVKFILEWSVQILKWRKLHLNLMLLNLMRFFHCFTTSGNS